MKKESAIAGLSILLILVISTSLSATPTVSADQNPGRVIYDSTPHPLPGNVVSQGFECCQVNEIGNFIQFAGTQRLLTTVTVTMSDWACENWATPSAQCTTTPGSSFPWPITLNLYDVVWASSPGDLCPTPETTCPTVGALIATQTNTFAIPYRPSATPTLCPSEPTAWFDPVSHTCFNGYAFNIVFDFTATHIVLPNEIIYGITYNTRDSGFTPTGSATPANSLNVGLTTTRPSVGTDIQGTMFRDAPILDIGSQDVGYNSNGAVNVFRQDTGWAPYIPAVQFTAT